MKGDIADIMTGLRKYMIIYVWSIHGSKYRWMERSATQFFSFLFFFCVPILSLVSVPVDFDLGL